jgi:hypothetical protein
MLHVSASLKASRLPYAADDALFCKPQFLHPLAYDVAVCLGFKASRSPYAADEVAVLQAPNFYTLWHTTSLYVANNCSLELKSVDVAVRRRRCAVLQVLESLIALLWVPGNSLSDSTQQVYCEKLYFVTVCFASPVLRVCGFCPDWV